MATPAPCVSRFDGICARKGWETGGGRNGCLGRGSAILMVVMVVVVVRSGTCCCCETLALASSLWADSSSLVRAALVVSRVNHVLLEPFESGESVSGTEERYTVDFSSVPPPPPPPIP